MKLRWEVERVLDKAAVCHVVVEFADEHPHYFNLTPVVDARGRQITFGESAVKVWTRPVYT